MLRSFWNLIRGQSSSRQSKSRRQAARPRHTVLSLERLEDRTAPATLTITSEGTFDLTTSSPSDHLSISNSGSMYTITDNESINCYAVGVSVVGSGTNTVVIQSVPYLDSFDINLDGGANTVNILGSWVPTNVNDFNPTNDSVILGTTGNPNNGQGRLANFDAPVTVQSHGGTMSLLLDDTGDSSSRNNVTVSNGGVTGLGNATITDAGGATLFLDAGSGNDNFTINNPGTFSTFLQTGHGSNNVWVEANSAFVNINDQGFDNVWVSSSAMNNYTGTVANINAEVFVTNTGASAQSGTILTVCNQGDSSFHSATLSNGSLTGLAPGTIHADSVTDFDIYGGSDPYGNVYTLNNPGPFSTHVSTGSAQDVVDVLAAANFFTVDGQGGTVEVYSPNVSNLHGGTQFEDIIGSSGSGHFSLGILDSDATVAQYVKLTNYAAGNLLTGLSPAPIYFGAAVTNLTIYGGSGGNQYTINDAGGTAFATTLYGHLYDTVLVEATTGQVTINGAGTVTLGNGTLWGLKGAVAVGPVSGSPTSPVLTVDDSADSIPSIVTLQNGLISGLPVTISFTGVSRLSVYGGTGGNDFDIESPSALSTYINTGSADGTVQVDSTTAPLTIGGASNGVTLGNATQQTLTALQGSVNIDNTGSGTTLLVNNGNDKTAHPHVNLDYGSLTGLAPVAITWGPTALYQLEVSDGSGLDSYTIDNPGLFPTYIDTNNSDDKVKVEGNTGLIEFNGKVLAKAVSKLALDGPKSTTAGATFQVTVTAQDANGNTLKSYAGTIQFYAIDQNGNVDQGAVLPPDYTFTPADNGSHKFTVSLAAVGTESFGVYETDETNTYPVGASIPVTVKPAPAVTFQVSPLASVTAGSAFDVTVTAKDTFGNTVTDDNGSVTLSSSDGQKVSGSSVTLVNGVGTAQVTLDVADQIKLVAVGGGIHGVSGLATVQAAGPSSIQVYAPTVVQAGAAFAATVVARDQFGNGCTGLVSLSSSDGQGGTPTSVSLANGVGTALVTLDKADTLTFNANLNGISGQSNSVTVYPGGLASFTVSAPSAATTKTAFSVQVTALDAFGNTVSDFSGAVALFSSDSQPVSPNVVLLTNGVGTAQVTLNQADPTGLIADYYNILGSSNTIQVSGVSTGPAVTFQVSPPASETAGTAFSVTVTAKDAYGNTTGYNGNVTLYSTDGQQVYGSTVTLTQGVGMAQVTLDVADPIELVAVGGGIYGVSGLTTVQAAAPSSVQVYAPTMAQAGAAFVVYVTAKDQFGNGCTGLVSLTTSDGQGGTPTSVSLVNGVGTAVVTLDKADTLTLQANLNGIVGKSNSVTVYPGGLASFTLSAPSTATAGTAFSVQVTALDAFGNTLTGFTGGVVLLSSDGQAVTPNVVMLTNGVGTAQVTLNTADPTGLIADYAGILGDSNTIQVSGASTPATAGPAVTFQVSPPASETAGTAFSITVTAKDASGNTATGDNGSVTLYSSDGQKVSGSSVTLVNGIGTALVTLDVADEVELVAVGGGIYGVSGLTTVQAAAPSSVQVYAPTMAQAGAAFVVYVTAKDQFGNGCTGLVSLTTSDGQGGTPTSVSLVNGVGTAVVTLDQADTLTLQANLNGTVGKSNSFTVYPGGLASLAVSAPSTATAGTAFSVRVTALDAFGNTLTDFTGWVVLLSSDGQPVNPNVVLLTNGVGTAQVTLNRADPTGLIADDYNILGDSNTIQVSGAGTSATPGPAVTFQVSPSASETAGTAFSVTVTAKDAYGNTATSDNGSVTLYSTDGQKVSGSSVTLVNGIGTAQVTLDVADEVELVAVGGGIYGVSGLTTVQAAAASTVQVYAPAVAQAGAAFVVYVTAKDQFGNGCTGLVSLTTSDGQGGLPTWVSLANGFGTAVVTLDQADTLTFQANLNGTVGKSNSFTVYPGGLASFVVSAPSTATAGTAFSVQVTALDAFGNTLTDFTGRVALLSSDGQPVKPNVVLLTNGVGTAQVTLSKADSTGLIADYYILGFSDDILVSD